MKILPHPIQYQGSKRNLAPVILRYFPNGINRLVEPFAGSAAISIAAAAKGLAQQFWINDLNQPLAELLKLSAEQPEELADLLGLREITFKSLYLSRILKEKLSFEPINHLKRQYLPEWQSFEFPKRHVSV